MTRSSYIIFMTMKKPTKQSHRKKKEKKSQRSQSTSSPIRLPQTYALVLCRTSRARSRNRIPRRGKLKRVIGDFSYSSSSSRASAVNPDSAERCTPRRKAAPGSCLKFPSAAAGGNSIRARAPPAHRPFSRGGGMWRRNNGILMGARVCSLG